MPCKMFNICDWMLLIWLVLQILRRRLRDIRSGELRALRLFDNFVNLFKWILWDGNLSTPSPNASNKVVSCAAHLTGCLCDLCFWGYKVYGPTGAIGLSSHVPIFYYFCFSLAKMFFFFTIICSKLNIHSHKFLKRKIVLNIKIVRFTTQAIFFVKKKVAKKRVNTCLWKI